MLKLILRHFSVPVLMQSSQHCWHPCISFRLHLLVLCAIVSSCVGPTIGVLTPGQGRLVYELAHTSYYGSDGIYVHDIDSNTTVEITDYYCSACYDPSWSYNGRYVVYVGIDYIVSDVPYPDYVVDRLIIADRKNNYDPALVIYEESNGLTWSNTWYEGFKYPDWSPSGDQIVLTVHYKEQSHVRRGIVLIEFPTPYDFSSYSVTPLVVYDFDDQGGLPADGEFSSDGDWIYFFATGPAYNGSGLFRIPSTGGTPEQLSSDGAPISHAYHPSVSTNGNTLIYNSELYKTGTAGHTQEELMALSIDSGIGEQLTHQAGHQAGRFAKNGSSQILLQDKIGKVQSLYSLIDGNQKPLLSPPANRSIGGADWWIPLTQHE